jgi:hypothetical protein
MNPKFIIYILGNWTCQCFSITDLAVNLDYALREGKTILRVEAI